MNASSNLDAKSPAVSNADLQLAVPGNTAPLTSSTESIAGDSPAGSLSPQSAPDNLGDSLDIRLLGSPAFKSRAALRRHCQSPISEYHSVRMFRRFAQMNLNRRLNRSRRYIRPLNHKGEYDPLPSEYPMQYSDNVMHSNACIRTQV